MQSSINRCLPQARINGEGYAAGRASGVIWGVLGVGAPSISGGMALTQTVGSSASIIPPGSTKIQKIFLMVYNNSFGFNPVGTPTCLRKQEVGKPSLYAAQPDAKAEGCVQDDPPRADKLRGWAFRVGTWNIDSLTGRSGELVEALPERRTDVAYVQETRWRGSGCRFFGAIGKRYKLFGMGSKAKTDGVGIFVAEKLVVLLVLKGTVRGHWS